MTRPLGSPGAHAPIWCAGTNTSNIYPGEGTDLLMCVLRREACHCAEVIATRDAHGSQVIPCRDVRTLWCFDPGNDDSYQCTLSRDSCAVARRDYHALVPEASLGRCAERFAR